MPAAPQIVVAPFSIAYEGNDADNHVISARPLGHSIVGAAQLYSATVHYCLFGFIPRGNYRRTFECYAQPARENCYEYQLFLATLSTEYLLHGDLYKEALKYVFAKVVDGIKKIWLKPGDAERVIGHLAEVMKEEARMHNELATVLANGLVKANDNLASLHSQLIETMPQVAAVTRVPGARLVAPVGNTCKSITQFARTDDASTISEAEAEVIRGGGEMEVDDMQQYRCRQITEVNRLNGHCILDVEGFDHLVVGKISDPTLEQPNNIYTRSMNQQTPFMVSAKLVRKAGIAHRLFISDAKAL